MTRADVTAARPGADESLWPPDDRLRRSARFRGQPHRLQGAERGGAACRAAWRPAHGHAGRPVHRPRHGPARHGRSVGWDVHQAIVENVYASVNDEAHAAFVLPDYMKKLIAPGHLGDKTPLLGGFYRRIREDGKTSDPGARPGQRQLRPARAGMQCPSSKRSATCTIAAVTARASSASWTPRATGRSRAQGGARLRQLRAKRVGAGRGGASATRTSTGS